MHKLTLFKLVSLTFILTGLGLQNVQAQVGGGGPASSPGCPVACNLATWVEGEGVDTNQNEAARQACIDANAGATDQWGLACQMYCVSGGCVKKSNVHLQGQECEGTSCEIQDGLGNLWHCLAAIEVTAWCACKNNN